LKSAAGDRNGFDPAKSPFTELRKQSDLLNSFQSLPQQAKSVARERIQTSNKDRISIISRQSKAKKYDFAQTQVVKTMPDYTS
jgi:hypothetical protein